VYEDLSTFSVKLRILVFFYGIWFAPCYFALLEENVFAVEWIYFVTATIVIALIKRNCHKNAKKAKTQRKGCEEFLQELIFLALNSFFTCERIANKLNLWALLQLFPDVSSSF